jgi:hypothetical protein
MVQRRNSNFITQLNTSQGNKLTSHQDIEHELISFFKPFFTKPQLDCSITIHSFTNYIPWLIVDDHNSSIMFTISQLEVEVVLMDMVVGKSLGPNGFTKNKILHYWYTIKNEVWALVVESEGI